jgi:DNA ligase-1
MAKTVFPKLFKKTSTGTIQEWEISTEGNVITTRFGQVGGAIQTASDTIREGKNRGKKNGTTPEEQTRKEAESKWGKQLKKGYVTSIEAAQADEVDEIIEGGLNPMLAQKYRDHAAKIVFPAAAQPKLDGIRCIAHVKDGTATLWSRTRKRINAVPHVAREIARLFPTGEHFTDGELYNHSLKSDFEKIVSIVRKNEPGLPGSEAVQYHVYDIASQPGSPWSKASFKDRNKALAEHVNGKSHIVEFVETIPVANEDALMEYFADCMTRGYEGCMVRNLHSFYENKRSYGLQKVKEMTDEEYPIIGVERGRGKDENRPVFVCKAKNGLEFRARLKGSNGEVSKYLLDKKLWENKELTVRYQNLTGDGVPRFPVGVAVRDYE